MSYQVIQAIEQNQLVAIIRITSTDEVESVVNSLFKGGIRIVEITMNSPGALQGIERVKRVFPEMVVGAGTVLDPETARSAILAGADFILTPTLKKETIEMGRRYDVAVIPGVLSPTEALTAYEYGASMVKIFPARTFGPSYIRDLHGPLPQLKCMAVGGIGLDNAHSYIEAGAAALGIGSSLVDERLILSGDFAEIEERARRFVQIQQEATTNKV
ncbi:bifunctional 4-hydroxy-2-oxoglutarate aldolase/2-dehydro-3-deoxy-phosphogluconate aldolase [Rossellomorea vietnamensis]|uniref:Bifunctional 4-hydroxy-2-oxoglutarate aldolase/2-dehydro-3-deoxy-phosphogluconate aldolase n=1 Tax=Rossellomorea vietnamensis TaxID=218284 RepID=A0ACD4C492_9BACI|nr:bifunctional 4-hydroxy-2-oxoglutarate aldolase/2-dehydro-3-deoxy-phosphogluconate aldolase [Rossellomorea vietnamensis]UXH43312.1 bifunctional 4-hydroxy-2-oxoglutarate aldolase/2-dehydro-3-deoxy-phosphogluconate aldolase [Rossellomorea vietnamensis]